MSRAAFQVAGEQWILAAALALRVALPTAVWLVGHDATSFLTPDSPAYLYAAHSLVERGVFDAVDGPQLLRTPGYPVLLIPGVVLGHPVLVALALQAILGVLTVYWVMRLTAALEVSRAASLVAGGLAAIEPVTLLWGSMLMAEGPLAFTVVMGVTLFVEHRRTGSRASLVAAAVALTAAAYVKPVAYFLAPLIALVDAWQSRRQPASHRLSGLALVAIWGALVLPWHLRNAHVAGYAGFSTQMDRVIAFSAPASVRAASEGRAFSDVRAEVRAQQQQPGFERSNPYAELRAQGLRTLLAKPWTYAGIHLRGMARTLLSPGAIPYLVLFGRVEVDSVEARLVKDRGSLAALDWVRRYRPGELLVLLSFGLLLVPYLALSALGALDRRWWLALATVLYFLVLSGGPWGQSRFRAPLMPVLCALAAPGIDRLRALRRSAR